MSKTELHEDRTRMDRDTELTELNPYYGGNQNEQNEIRWKTLAEVEEWVYDQAYDCGIEPLWKIVPSEIKRKIGELYLQEGPKAAEAFLDEEIQTCVEIANRERLSGYVDGQMRLFAGYDVAENGDTLEEGEYESWENLRIRWEAGIQDRLRDNEKYESL